MSEPGPIGGLPTSCVIIGGGRMGCGIAHAMLVGGSFVQVVERGTAEVRACTTRVGSLVDQSVLRGTTSEDALHVMARLRVSTAAVGLRDVSLVVEALPEDASVKGHALADVERLVGDDCVLASNTSSLSISRLAEALSRPERFVGMHFFNPVPASALVEVVRGAQTSPAVVKRVTRWARMLGKEPIVVVDSAGFASSRLGVALGLEAIRMVEQGVASPTDIDTAMTLGYRHPMGPLRLTDMVGLDVRLNISRHLVDELGERFEPPSLLVEMVARGELGRKSGRGFYDWPEF